MNEALVKRILQKFGFHQQELAFVQVETMLGGRQHNTFKITLSTGSSYVLKHLNLHCYLGHYTAAHFNASEQFASYVNQKLQHSMVAIKSEKDYVANINGAYFLLYPWIQGKVLHQLTIAQARLLGTYLANIHQLPSIDVSLESMPSNSFKIAQWHKLVEMGLLESAALSQLIKMAYQCGQDMHTYQGKYALSHRDMNLDNFLWRSDLEFICIDWESSGYISPAVDLIGLAINVAGIANGMLDLSLIEATIQAYSENIEVHMPINHMDFSLSFASWFSWLDYCLSTNNMTEQLRETEIKLILQAINLLEQHKDYFLTISL